LILKDGGDLMECMRYGNYRRTYFTAAFLATDPRGTTTIKHQVQTTQCSGTRSEHRLGIGCP